MSLVDQLKARGLQARVVSVGAVEFELLHPASYAGVGPTLSDVLTRLPTKSIVEEYGGPEMAKLLNDQPDLVDDEDQPAVRS